MTVKTFDAQENYSRADIFISENLSGYTRSSVKNFSKAGSLRLTAKR